MATVKKPVKKRDTTSPNTPLVIFVVFFALLSIGLGVWGYYGYAGQHNLKKKTDEAATKEKGARQGEEYNRYIQLETRLMIGDEGLTPDEKATWEKLRGQFAAGEFKEDNLEAITKFIEKQRGILKYDATANAYKKTFKDVINEEKAKIPPLEASASAKERRIKALEVAVLAGFLRQPAEDIKAVEDVLKRLQNLDPKEEQVVKNFLEKLKPDEDPFRKDIIARIEKNAAAALAEAKKQPDQLGKALDAIAAVRKEKDAIIADLTRRTQELEADVKLKAAELAEARKKVDPVAAALAEQAKIPLRDPHALLLDISSGKALWDLPRGKIVRIDLKERQVYINLGTSAGVKPQLTFNVFAPSWAGRAEKGMKGTIEVTRVIDANSSLATVTSMYDADGLEIPLSQARLRIQREADNPMKEGDLLFNLTWGSHAAIAGPVNWSGLPGDNPADQMRHLEAFKILLERQGVSVDAYIDLNDGQLKGAMTPQTRFLIRGDFISPEARDGKSDRAKAINNAILDMRKEAIEKGMFIISGDNLAMVMGYRQPRSADDASVSAFRPRVPYSGANYIQLLEKENGKAPEKKEKKDEKMEKDN